MPDGREQGDQKLKQNLTQKKGFSAYFTGRTLLYINFAFCSVAQFAPIIICKVSLHHS